jgi:hypothetical protein
MNVVCFRMKIGKYRIQLNTSHLITTLDATIAYVSGLSTAEYRSILSENFNAFIFDTGLAYEIEEDCINAKEWIESMIVMNKLKK